MIEIEVKNIEKYHGSDHVLKGISFEIQKGEKVAFVGKNGCGKTTLFNILSGTDKQDKGEIFIAKNSTVGIVEQIPNFQDNLTVRQIMNSAFKKIYDIREKMLELENAMLCCSSTDKMLRKYGDLQEAFQFQGGYEIEDKISRVCKGLKISDEELNKYFSNLSGGEQTRIMLARAILLAPNILFLDEPTNHLDVNSIEWLEEFLKEYHGTILIISHDRFFLDKVAQKIIEIEGGRSTSFIGNYSDYHKEKDEILKREQHEYDLYRQNIRKLEVTVKRLHDWGNRGDEISYHHAASKLQAIVKEMKKKPKPGNQKTINSQFAQYDFSSQDVVIFQNASKNFGDRNIFSNVSMIIKDGERVAIVGNNGAGKSTLIKALIGEIRVEQGSARLGGSIKPAYLPQVITFENSQWSLLETIKQELKISEENAIPLLVKYNFSKQDWNKTVSNISGGERIRLKICLLMQQDINLLVLDEPTNHLDINSREWLEDAIQNFAGTLVFISHDRYFVNKFATRVIELEAGKLNDFACDYSSYREIKEREVKVTLTQPKGQSNIKPVANLKKSDNSNHLSCLKIENEISQFEKELKTFEQEMLKGNDDPVRLLETYNEYEKLKKRIELLYQQWYMLNK